MNRPPRPPESGQTLVGPPPVRLGNGDPDKTPESGYTLPDRPDDPMADSKFYSLLIHEHAVDKREMTASLEHLSGKVDAAIDDVRSLAKTALELDIKLDRTDKTIAELIDAVRGLTRTIEPIVALPELVHTLAKEQRELRNAVMRLDERLSRAERRGDSQSDIVERVASLHIEDETTEVKARSLAVLRAHEQRTAALVIVKRIAKWVFAGGGAALLGAAIARGCGG